ncbi:restriction endonuclease subunit S [Salmonella enterica]|uniref:restriction endonuclease subunit S n=1 Tax=Enterobacteriaceae TaxID=543 RepID=UPI000E2C77F8|nr:MULTISPECIES: restriction endonuclease subunit S [Enterobacteriaceae]EGZ8146493.1 restriction endonuclease subunit S [Salmonella enterica subsp. enterica serovar Agona]ELS4779505.1 restriction endonuclease subunit S [Salmonella enterica]MCX9376549.1 restriction endonuclease subunit S [Escherichia coli]UFM72143.1 restriction endonuclease subunit S [Leclercia adecarboxylata]SWN85207.1 Restriction modification system DNA specificity domain protein [Klebsiella pneumoniae]
MSVLSYLEKLLNGVDIQWKTIGEVTLRTSNIKWREATRSYRYVDLTSVDIETKKITETTEVTANNAPSRAQKLIEENDVIFATTRPTQQRFCLIDGEYSDEVASTGFCVLRAKQDEVLPKWIWHWISTSYFKKYVEENQSGSAYPAISDAKVKECYIPVPCPENPEKSLAIQSEIVRILDKFTALTAELTAELTARKKQYNYYRDQLLSFDEEQEKHIYLEKLLDGVEVEWKTLGEVAKYVRGLIYSKSSESADGQGYKVLRANNITLSNNCLNLNDVKVVRFDTKVKSSQKLYKNDILISAASGSREHVGKVAYIESDIDYYFGGFMGVVRCDEKLNPRYLFHVLTSDIFQKYLDEMLNSSTINNLNSAVMGRFKIPLPCPDTPEKSLAIQSEIVRILDKFDTLTNSITEGLPREIELRQKQYEYYRDLLFSFPKPDSVTN